MFYLFLILTFAMAIGMGKSGDIPICENSTLLVSARVTRSYRQVELIIRFRTDRQITGGLATGTYWLWNIIPITQSLTELPLCAAIDSGCPLQPGDTIYTYRHRIRTRRMQIAGTLSWILSDQEGQRLLCANVPVVVR
ncbi:hypothetical protein FGIG_10518 [Fasciola gigantica]|uniref:MD-2-related lipid-recognition domain-containing protein n=1 Tax=Fasciola gigantica TaxID=46835 RepID=A0A504WT04_FASGI|nr:hypothetical protein FGIG_10518 [Fasciola gigantica]